jgi:SAM-dependent methyltransferase
MVTSADPLALVRESAAAIGDDTYANFVSAKPFSYYRTRVKELRLGNRGRVLDVGCGFGHWSAALALENDEVVGIDRSAPRLAIAEELIASLDLTNVRFDVGDAADALPYEDKSFDVLFCYSVFMFLDRDRALAEFRRVLALGGRLYVNTAARGWWLRLWLRSLRGPGAVRRSAFHGLAYGGRGDPPHATSRRAARELLRDGWTNVQADFDDHIGRASGETREPPYAPTFLGLDAVVELVADRAGRDATADVAERIRRTIEQTSYDYVTPLESHPQPRPVLDLVGNCDLAAIRRALAHARVVDRVAVLRDLYRDVTRGAATDEERVLRCVTFAQLHFFHHFGGQPMHDGRPVQDPVASLLLDIGRCGASAAFLVDLFACNNIPSRLAGGAAHTWAEALCDGRWVIADANLFPPGILPRNESGGLLSTDEAIVDPRLLDRAPSYINYHYEYIDAFLHEYPETERDLGRWLRWPLLPSSGYFGSSLFAGEPCVQRSRKVGGPAEWSADGAFGWSALESELVSIEGTPVLQRPSQVRDVRIDGNEVVWTPASAADGGPVRYRLFVSATSRGWEYDALPVGCTFDLSGTTLVVDEPRVALDSVALEGRYLSVVAESPLLDERVFYLPSRELRLAS